MDLGFLVAYMISVAEALHNATSTIKSKLPRYKPQVRG